MKQWFYNMFYTPYTVCVDRGPFRTPLNDQEQLFHVWGLRKARRVAKDWVRVHTNGQARIILGHVEFDKEEA